MTLRIRCMTFALAALAACGGSVDVSSGTETITGTERFGWDQPATDAGELSSFRYAMYVDDARSEAANVQCATAATSGRFACTARMPEMSNGSHTVQVAAFVIDAGVTRESTRSTTLRVVRR